MLLLTLARILALTNALPHTSVPEWSRIDNNTTGTTLALPSALSPAPETITPPALDATNKQNTAPSTSTSDASPTPSPAHLPLPTSLARNEHTAPPTCPWCTTPTTLLLIAYDLSTLAILLYLWLFGYLWWMRSQRSINNAPPPYGEVEGLRRVDMRMWEGVDAGVVGSASLERRRGEIEGEMRRLGMI
ncbi:hypothetical protein P153DRAFT_380305 [Dothidotthia symphoricarpi CBS 119687]|uniref:Uncharacterized protein n=1 Tax=Dothidotthia symphoricarpi CBS 119687 TaxID=1392245 RepID=A0A6A6AUF7_9PLEO|nr:uncharacterized protein P153DRAFT_380305 [Dothidotthia symphoricarpi CBS 119687]KAF2134487.1 hypothetical protein P153DRAFT_380305 [Dothidotthia symphoricarpi CBS 119687]